MGKHDFMAEEPENASQKTICCFVVDVSGSMDGAPLNSLNQGLKDFHSTIYKDETLADRLEIAVVTFGSEIDTVVSPALSDNIDKMPTLDWNGSTKLVDGMRHGIDLVEARKEWYKSTSQPYLRPWIILITDGEPDEDQDVDGLEQQIEQATKGKKFIFLTLGVEGADMNMLKNISGYQQNKDKIWEKTPPLKLQGLKFTDFFKWVSASIGAEGVDDTGGFYIGNDDDEDFGFDTI